MRRVGASGRQLLRGRVPGGALQLRAALRPSEDPEWPMRDVFYLSKCHAAPALYTHSGALWLLPHRSTEVLRRLGLGPGVASRLPGDARASRSAADRSAKFRAWPWGGRWAFGTTGPITTTAWSTSWWRWRVQRGLGVGGLHGRRATANSTTWSFIIDYNKVQAKGFLSQDMSIEPLADKLRAFNLDVFETENGHDVPELVTVFNHIGHQRRGKPTGADPEHHQGQEGARMPVQPQLAHLGAAQRAGGRHVAARAVGTGRPAAWHPRGVPGRPDRGDRDRAAACTTIPTRWSTGRHRRRDDGTVHYPRPERNQGDALPHGVCPLRSGL